MSATGYQAPFLQNIFTRNFKATMEAAQKVLPFSPTSGSGVGGSGVSVPGTDHLQWRAKRDHFGVKSDFSPFLSA